MWKNRVLYFKAVFDIFLQKCSSKNTDMNMKSNMPSVGNIKRTEWSN